MVSSSAWDLWGDTYTFCLTLLVTWAESFLVLLQCNYGRWTRTPCSDGAGAPRRACLHHPRRGTALPPRSRTPRRSSVSSFHWRRSSGETGAESLKAARSWKCWCCSPHIMHHLSSKTHTHTHSYSLHSAKPFHKANTWSQCRRCRLTPQSVLLLYCQKPGSGSALSDSLFLFQVCERYSKVLLSAAG